MNMVRRLTLSAIVFALLVLGAMSCEVQPHAQAPAVVAVLQTVTDDESHIVGWVLLVPSSPSTLTCIFVNHAGAVYKLDGCGR